MANPSHHRNMHLAPTLPLASGNAMPVVGLGLWKIAPEATADIVRQAIAAGYRHLDCACDYGNEPQAGAGIRAAIAEGLCRRQDLWVTSKLWNTYHAAEHVQPAVERSLHDLGLDYLDLYLMHFPIAQRFVPFETRYPPGWFFDPKAARPAMEFAKVQLAETWQAIEELVAAGLTRSIGVCNCNCALLRDLVSYARICPAVLQVELHPYLTQEKLLRFCREAAIAVTGFSPLGAVSYLPLKMASAEESVLDERVVLDAARRHAKTPAQIVMRWAVQRGTAIVPKTSRPERLAENLALFDFELSPHEMLAIGQLNRNRRFNDPGVFCEQAFNTFCPIYE
ncbi:MAG TPA: aldo/keto reductase [Pirellulales bacterium]|nr:aldo/keto reductase [Pirellulales bacterium]